MMFFWLLRHRCCSTRGSRVCEDIMLKKTLEKGSVASRKVVIQVMDASLTVSRILARGNNIASLV